jgi:fatty-acyl-CoA synthase
MLTARVQWHSRTHAQVPTHVRFMDEFPMTVTGKIQKFMLREQLQGQLGAKEVPA